MELKVLGSGSSGNCYRLLPQNGKGLLIECGLTFRQIKEGVDFDLFNIAGCILSHEHKSDHAKCPQELINSGIPVITSFGTAAALKLNNPTCVMAGDLFEVGEFEIKAFKVEHDAIEPFGFLIHHNEMGLMVFITDSKIFDYAIDNVTHWLIEANFSETLMLENIENSKVNAFLANRVYQNHMSIETTIKVLKNNDLSQCQSITLIHLSSNNGDGEKFVEMVSKAIGIKPKIATNGMIIEL